MTTSVGEQPLQLEKQLQNKYLCLDPLSELQLLKNQQELLTSIKQLIEKRKYTTNFNNNNSNNYSSYNMDILSINGINCANLNHANVNNATNVTQLLDLSNNSINCFANLDFQQDDNGSRSKFRDEIQASTQATALKEIEVKCSQETYQIAKQYFNSTKSSSVTNTALSSLQKMNAKLLEQRDQLSSQLVIQKLQKSSLQKQLGSYKKQAQSLENEKQKYNKKSQFLLKKQNQISKLQSSFIFKQKLNLELKKRYERLVIEARSMQKKIEYIYQQFYKIWQFVTNKVQQNKGSLETCGDGNCWRKQVMKKIKEQLVEERKLLKQESKFLEKQYEVMNVVSEQFKRILQESQNLGESFGSQKSVKLDDGNVSTRMNTKN